MNPTTTSHSPIERSFSPKTVAQQLDVPDRKLVAMIREGELRGFKVGRLWRIPESAIVELMQGADA